MGYAVHKLVLYDLSHNKTYPIPLPHQDLQMFNKFKNLLKDMQSFQIEDPHFTQNPAKCNRCIYNNLCDYYSNEP